MLKQALLDASRELGDSHSAFLVQWSLEVEQMPDENGRCPHVHCLLALSVVLE
jgi:hypothetical protein